MHLAKGENEFQTAMQSQEAKAAATQLHNSLQTGDIDYARQVIEQNRGSIDSLGDMGLTTDKILQMIQTPEGAQQVMQMAQGVMGAGQAEDGRTAHR